MCSFVKMNVLWIGVKMMELKFLSTDEGTKEVAKDLVAFYRFLNLIQKENFLECGTRKWIQNERIEKLRLPANTKLILRRMCL